MPYGILSKLQVELGGKTVEIEVEVIDGNLDYNILLGMPWIYAMVVVVSTYFRKIAFPFQGGITIIDQLTFLPNSSQVTRSIPLIHGSSQSLQNIGIGLLKYPYLMGNFSLRPPSNLAEVATVETCHMISSTSSKIKNNSEHFDSIDHREVFPPSPTIPTSSNDQLSDVVHYVLGALEPNLSFMTPYEL